MTLECLMAFTVIDDHRRQLKVFKALTDWQKEDPKAIRAALTEKMVESRDKLARFVGLDAYVAAVVPPRRLVRHEVYLEKPTSCTSWLRRSWRPSAVNWKPRAGMGRDQPGSQLRGDTTAAAEFSRGWSGFRPS